MFSVHPEHHCFSVSSGISFMVSWLIRRTVQKDRSSCGQTSNFRKRRRAKTTGLRGLIGQ